MNAKLRGTQYRYRRKYHRAVLLQAAIYSPLRSARIRAVVALRTHRHLCISRLKFDKYSLVLAYRGDGCRRDLSTSAWILDSRRDDGRLRDATVTSYFRDKDALRRRSGAMRRIGVSSSRVTRQENSPGFSFSQENAYRTGCMYVSERSSISLLLFFSLFLSRIQK